MWKDPIVEEVRKAREEIFAECDHDLTKLMQRGRRFLRRWKGKVVTKADLQQQRSAQGARRSAR
jgi:hypothetical protein